MRLVDVLQYGAVWALLAGVAVFIALDYMPEEDESDDALDAPRTRN